MEIKLLCVCVHVATLKISYLCMLPYFSSMYPSEQLILHIHSIVGKFMLNIKSSVEIYAWEANIFPFYFFLLQKYLHCWNMLTTIYAKFLKKKKKAKKNKKLYCLFMDFKLLKSSRVQMQVFLGWNELVNLYGSGDKIIKSGCWKFSWQCYFAASSKRR